LRLLNQRRIMEQLFLVEKASRAELAMSTGISRPTAGYIIDELLAAKVLEERPADSPVPSGRPGRPGRLVAFESRTPRVILVQVGVKKTQLAAVPLGVSDEIAWTHDFATPQSEVTFMRKLKDARAELTVTKPWAFALSLPGVYDEQQGQSRLSPNLHWIEGSRLHANIETQWKLPGCGLQEIRALALGHTTHARSMQDFLLVDADEGVGAAALIRGQLLEGPLASSGEIGHTVVAGNRRTCGCGGTGCLETLLSRAGLLASHAAASKKRDPSWEELVVALGRQQAIPSWFFETMQACAITVGGALNLLGLDRVVLTGLFETLPSHCLAQLAQQIESASLVARFGRVQVSVAQRRRAQGLLRRVLHRLVIPTEDWRKPCAVARAD
jgi:predicted NBD/HSP70 family sugar kinase